MSNKLILSINPGSTSTKIAVYEETRKIFAKNLNHSVEELGAFADMADQFHFRKDIILKELKEAGIDIRKLNAIVGRGGWLKPVRAGVYGVNDAMKKRLRYGIQQTQHASNLGGLIADDIAAGIPGARAFIADPPVVDEMDDVARISGHPLFQRRALFHPLNQRAVARRHAASLGKKYDEINLIVAHMGGGISVGAHRRGRIVDVNNALDGEGPFTPERSGGLPAADVAKLCFSGDYTLHDIKKMIAGKGGCVAYLGTTDNREIEARVAADDKQATLIENAMAYQVAKEIGAMYTALAGDVDAIVLTGGLAYNRPFIKKITVRIEKLAPVAVYPGEDEMEALAMNGLMALNGETDVLEYTN